MARTAPPGHRQHLEQMATTWEQLAAARKRQLLKQGKQDEKSGLQGTKTAFRVSVASTTLGR
jgi:hypothetical protein